ncbi:hypothetical protein AJ87_23520 [Rhizobium yanglingense]|nr:hypothetical protein AJ87_23520 [Rhizobium yanglingense]
MRPPHAQARWELALQRAGRARWHRRHRERERPEAISAGTNAIASGVNSIYLGSRNPLGNAGALGLDSIAVGTEVRATQTDTTAIGHVAMALGVRATAIGSNALATETNATALGYNSFAGGSDAIAMGTSAAAETADSVAIGTGANALGGKAVAIGAGNVAYGDGAVSIGDPSYASGTGAFTGGANNIANADGTASATAANAANGAVAIGNNNVAIGQGSVALGNFSRAGAAGAVAFGDAAVANNADDVALGSGSVTAAAVGTANTTINGTVYTFAGTATPASTVSVGAAGAERTITNVAAGRINGGSTDAINGSQLFATNQAVDSLATTVNNINTGGGIKYFHANSALPDSQALGTDSVAIGPMRLPTMPATSHRPQFGVGHDDGRRRGDDRQHGLHLCRRDAGRRVLGRCAGCRAPDPERRGRAALGQLD